MRKSFQFRIFPTKKQKTLLLNTLEQCRRLYNHLLEERKRRWEEEKKGLSLYDQMKTFPILKRRVPELSGVHSQVLQNVAVRIDLGFKAFFRRIKQGADPGYPRFRGYGRYDSFTYPQTGFRLNDKSVSLSKIGKVKAVMHRPAEGTIKTCTVRKTATGKWFVSFSCEVNKAILPDNQSFVGLDAGLTSFVTLSSGEKVDNPRFFKEEEKNLAKAQRKLSRQAKGTNKRHKCQKVVARVHERITNKRQDFSHKLSSNLVNSYGTIAVEDLSINDMQKDNFRCINKGIADVAWRNFFDQLTYKAECAGRTVVKVNPAYSSQTCSRCGYRQKIQLSERTYHCPCCSLSMDRDVNAALNILSLGLQTVRSRPEEAACFSWRSSHSAKDDLLATGLDSPGPRS
jgi:putative transposase